MSYTFTYTHDDTNATITGINWVLNPEELGDVVIPATIDGYTVTAIGNGAFTADANMITVSLPEGLLSIGDSAFSGCLGLYSNIVIPNSVISIGASAFSNCVNIIGNLTIGNSVETIGDSAFSGCAFSGDLVIPNSVTSIGMIAFSSCSGLNGSLTIGNGVTLLGSYVFAGSGLTSAWFCGNLPVTTPSESPFISTSVAAIYRFEAATGWSSTFESIPVVTIPYTEMSESNVAIGESYGLGGTRTGTMKVGQGINGSGILGFM
jgi:hypothetical protein